MKKLSLICLVALCACSKAPSDTTSAADSVTAPLETEQTAAAPDGVAAPDPTIDNSLDYSTDPGDDYGEGGDSEGEEEGNDPEEQVDESPWVVPVPERYFSGSIGDRKITMSMHGYGGTMVWGFYRFLDEQDRVSFNGNLDSAAATFKIKASITVDAKQVVVATFEGTLANIQQPNADEISGEMRGTWTNAANTEKLPFNAKVIGPGRSPRAFTLEHTGNVQNGDSVRVSKIYVYNENATQVQELDGFDSKRWDGANLGMHFRDVNFDGIPDLCLWGNDFAFYIWVYDDKKDQYVLVPESPNISEPEVDFADKKVIGSEVVARGVQSIDKYIYKDGHLLMVERVLHPMRGGPVIKKILYDIVDGKSVEKP